jgi:hypothetical protein
MAPGRRRIHGTHDIAKFEPKVTWMGSANWTVQARHHIEHGLWSRDPALVEQNYEYLLSLIRFSEPRGAATIGPEPELVSAIFDDEAGDPARVEDAAAAVDR